MRYPLLASLVLASALPAAQAADMNLFAQCALVPWATFSGPGVTTAVGVVVKDGGTVEWAYFDEDGNLLQSGFFGVTDDLLVPVALDQVLDPALANIQGSMLFCLDDNDDGDIDGDDGEDLAANAFYVDVSTNDVAYIPTLPVFEDGLDETDPEDWDQSPVDDLQVGADSDDRIYLQYAIDGTPNSGDGTILVLYTTDEPNSNATMLASGPNQINNVSVNLPNSRVNLVDVESITDITSTIGLLGSGFLRWEVGDNVDNAFGFSLAFSPAFGALQTLLGHVELD